MASLIILNGTGGLTYDLTRFIPVPDYKVNAVEEYEEWTDSNYGTHRRLVSSKAKGTFKLKFPSIAEYADFMTFFNTYTDSDTGAISADVWLTYPYIVRSAIDVFLTFAPQDDLPLIADGKASGFEVTLMQKESGL